MITIEHFTNFIRNHQGITTSEIEKEFDLSRAQIQRLCSSAPDLIKVIKDGRNSRHFINPEELVYNEVSINIDASFPTKQLIKMQFDVTNNTKKKIPDYRVFKCEYHDLT